MFRVEFFVDDKLLPKALWLLVGTAIGTPKAEPVVNAEVKGGKIRARTNGSTKAMFTEWLKGRTGELTPNDMRAFCTEIGIQAKSYSNLLRDALDAGLIKKKRIPGAKGTRAPYQYEVVKS
jgi:hypothetical protein